MSEIEFELAIKADAFGTSTSSSIPSKCRAFCPANTGDNIDETKNVRIKSNGDFIKWMFPQI